MKHAMMVGSLLFIALLAVREAVPQEPAASPIVIAQGPPAELGSITGEGTWQLRIYTINRGRLDDFVDAWLTGAYPVRVAHGFKIPSAWVIRERNQFVWLIGYDGPGDWDSAQQAYYGSAARTGLDVDPLQFIAHGDTFFITPVTSSR
jgi:hypothetical protein